MHLGYLGIISLMVLSPFPPEFFIPLAGFMVAQGQLSLAGVITAGVVGFLLSALPWYLAGRFLGEKRLSKLLQHNRWLKLSVSDLYRAKRWFRRNGGKAILMALFIPGSRNLIALPAGLSGMSLFKFLLYLVNGAIVWISSLTLLGYFLGDRYHLIEKYFSSTYSVVLLAVMATCSIWAVSYHWQRKGRSFTRR